jgi:hypothetical protein
LIIRKYYKLVNLIACRVSTDNNMLKIRKALFMTPKYYIAIFLSILLIGCSFLVDSEDSASTNFCEPNPCLNGSECIPTSERYYCDCTNGWDGDNCEISNSLLVGEWEFYIATAYTNLTCSGNPFAQYYTSSPAWLALFPGNLSNYELTVTYNSDLTITQTQTTVSGGNIEIDIDTGSIIDSGTEKCVTWDEGSSSACESCSPYTINGDTLVTTNYCAGIYPCQKWTSIRQY